jgi:sec-independent protein translocase protein TatA
MGNLGPGELLVVVLVLVLLFGSKKLPELARSVGRASSEFKKGIREATEDDGAESAKTEGRPGHAGEMAPGPPEEKKRA